MVEVLSYVVIAEKLLCFKINGVSTFQGIKTGVIEQINTNCAPFSVGVHFMVHR
jgi:hypothetical protein